MMRNERTCIIKRQAFIERTVEPRMDDNIIMGGGELKKVEQLIFNAGENKVSRLASA